MSDIFLPQLPLNEWQDTQATLPIWGQIVVKIANARTPIVKRDKLERSFAKRA